MKRPSDTRQRALQLVEALESELLPVSDGTPRSSDTDQRTLQILESLAHKFGLIPPLESAVADVTFSIGTSSRDYSTAVAWEADLDNGALYSASDAAIGERYNDSTFNDILLLNGGGTIGLSSVKVTTPSAERHDGTEGTGAREVGNGGVKLVGGSVPYIYEWYEHDHNTSEIAAALNRASVWGDSSVGEQAALVNNLIIHDASSTAGSNIYGVSATGFGRTGTEEYNNIAVYDILRNSSFGNGYGILTSQCNLQNCSVLRVEGASGSATGTGINGGNNQTNCIAMDCTTDDFGAAVLSGTRSYCISSDTTATGTGSQTSKISSNNFTNTTAGSVDVTPPTGADSIDNGTDLGTTNGVNIDLKGRDRDANGDTWDVGAIEFVSAVTGLGSLVNGGLVNSGLVNAGLLDK